MNRTVAAHVATPSQGEEKTTKYLKKIYLPICGIAGHWESSGHLKKIRFATWQGAKLCLRHVTGTGRKSGKCVMNTMTWCEVK